MKWVNTNKTLPPYFLNKDENSFARKTFLSRKPAIIKKIINANNFNEIQRKALEGLSDDLTGGIVRDPFTEFPYSCDGLDPGFKEIWDVELLPYIGKRWLDLPFYFAEALLYFEILIASGYFDTSSGFFMKDIYQVFKDEELLGDNGAMKNTASIVSDLVTRKYAEGLIKELIYLSLWGNRIDLSMYHIVKDGKNLFLNKDHQKRLLIDHSDAITSFILNTERIDFVLDNAGQELVCDLLLVWAILMNTENTRVYLHLKKYPFYVSDAMVKDFFQTLECFIKSPESVENPYLIEVGKTLQHYLNESRLKVQDHYFWNSSLFYTELPEDLRRDFESSNLVIFKGDVNYRRLLEDRRWDISESMETLVDYFPTNLAVIRTMKSELVVDIPREMAEQLESEDPEWKINGLRGMIRFVRK